MSPCRPHQRSVLMVKFLIENNDMKIILATVISCFFPIIMESQERINRHSVKRIINFTNEQYDSNTEVILVYRSHLLGVDLYFTITEKSHYNTTEDIGVDLFNNNFIIYPFNDYFLIRSMKIESHNSIEVYSEYFNGINNNRFSKGLNIYLQKIIFDVEIDKIIEPLIDGFISYCNSTNFSKKEIQMFNKIPFNFIFESKVAQQTLTNS